MSSLGVGLLGSGRRGEYHAFAISSIPGFCLKAVTSENEEKGREFALRHHIPRVYDDIEYLLEDRDIEVVVVATPTPRHLQECSAIIRSGRSLIVETPLASSHQEAERLVQLSEEEGVYLFPVSLLSFLDNLSLVRDFSREKEVEFSALWSSPFPLERWKRGWKDYTVSEERMILESSIESLDVLESLFGELTLKNAKRRGDSLSIFFDKGRLDIENGQKGLLLEVRRKDGELFYENGKITFIEDGRLNRTVEWEKRGMLSIFSAWYRETVEVLERGEWNTSTIERTLLSLGIIEKAMEKLSRSGEDFS